VRNRCSGYRHDVEIVGRIGLQVHLHHRVPEQLFQPRSTFLGRGQGVPPLDLAQYFHQVPPCDVENRPLAEGGQDVLGENPVDLRERALPTGLQTERLVSQPKNRCGLYPILCTNLCTKKSWNSVDFPGTQWTIFREC